MKIIEDLNYDMDFIIIGGVHDKVALRCLGYHESITRLCSSGLTIFGFTDEISIEFR